MVRYLKKLRIADSLSHLLLNEFQRELIPYFDKNILSSDIRNTVKKQKTLCGGDYQLLNKSMK